MPNVFEGDLDANGRYAIVAAKFNAEIVDLLVAGALAAFKKHGVADDDVDLVRVPGSFEIPLAAHLVAESEEYDAVVCLGAVIKGDTDHYEYVCRAVTDGVLKAGISTGMPVIFGVLTCATEELAMDRAGGKHGNKGADAAEAAIEMASLMFKLSEE